MPHAHRFCVVAQARTGSEHLTSRLNAHPAIACHRELFNARHVVSALPAAFHPRLPTIEERDARPLEALERIVALSEEAFPRRPVFGFKLFLTHAREVRQHVRADERYRLVLLERRNKLAQYVSLQAAMATGRWNAFAGGAASDGAGPGPVRVAVDLDAFARWLEKEGDRLARFEARLAGRPGVLRLASEEIDRRLAEVQAFLGVLPRDDLPVLRARQNPQPLAERIVNREAVAAWLASRGRATWLDEGQDEVAGARGNTGSAAAERPLE